MAQQRHLENAPITEALVDFRVSLSREFDATVFADLKTVLADRYPIIEQMRQFEAKLELMPGRKTVAAVPGGKVQGFRFRSQDGLNLAQFRADGFTYNRLAPYTEWSTVFPEAIRLWGLFVETARPPFVSRVALRYLNQLRPPIQSGDPLDKYLAALPPMPPGAPGGFAGFVSRISTHDPVTRLSANVTQALEAPDPTILLDIDVYKAGEFETTTPALAPVFQALHQLKNEIFFGSITEETARLYDRRNPA
jgi:uncharacterized protein (TIGR04255 family)